MTKALHDRACLAKVAFEILVGERVVENWGRTSEIVADCLIDCDWYREALAATDAAHVHCLASRRWEAIGRRLQHKRNALAWKMGNARTCAQLSSMACLALNFSRMLKIREYRTRAGRSVIDRYVDGWFEVPANRAGLVLVKRRLRAMGASKAFACWAVEMRVDHLPMEVELPNGRVLRVRFEEARDR